MSKKYPNVEKLFARIGTTYKVSYKHHPDRQVVTIDFDYLETAEFQYGIFEAACAGDNCRWALLTSFYDNGVFVMAEALKSTEEAIRKDIEENKRAPKDKKIASLKAEFKDRLNNIDIGGLSGGASVFEYVKALEGFLFEKIAEIQKEK